MSRYESEYGTNWDQDQVPTMERADSKSSCSSTGTTVPSLDIALLSQQVSPTPINPPQELEPCVPDAPTVGEGNSLPVATCKGKGKGMGRPLHGKGGKGKGKGPPLRGKGGKGKGITQLGKGSDWQSLKLAKVCSSSRSISTLYS